MAEENLRKTKALATLILVNLCSSVVVLPLQLLLQPLARASHLNHANGAHLARAILPCYKHLRAE